MDWLLIIGFIVFGIGLVIIEIIFVPGTTIVGVGGIICMAYGIYTAFTKFGNEVGWITLSISLLASLVILLLSFKSNAWERFSLKNTMTQKLNAEHVAKFKIGDLGETISSLKPIGKAMINDQIAEVRSQGTFVQEKQKIKIIKIDHNKIFVEPIIES